MGLWAGKLVDSMDRRMLVQLVAGCRVLVLSALAMLIAFDATPLWLVAVAAFVLGTSEVLSDNVSGAVVPMLVPARHLEKANSRLVGVQIIGDELVGPIIGAWLFAIGAALPFFANASLLAGAVLLLAGLPLLAPAPTLGPQASQSPDPTGLLEGLSTIRNQPVLRAITMASAALAAADAAWFVLLVVFVRDRLGLGATGFGLLLAVGAIGGLGGALIADRKATWPLRTVSRLVFGSMAVSLLILGLFPTVGVTGAVLAATSGGFALWNTRAVSARQRATPNELLGRVGATYRSIVVSVGLLSALAGGVVADLASIEVTLIIVGVGSAVAGLLLDRSI